MGIRAEEKVDVELTKYAKKIIGKAKLLYKLAKAAMGQPDGVVKEVIYPVVGEKDPGGSDIRGRGSRKNCSVAPQTPNSLNDVSVLLVL